MGAQALREIAERLMSRELMLSPAAKWVATLFTVAESFDSLAWQSAQRREWHKHQWEQMAPATLEGVV